MESMLWVFVFQFCLVAVDQSPLYIPYSGCCSDRMKQITLSSYHCQDSHNCDRPINTEMRQVVIIYLADISVAGIADSSIPNKSTQKSNNNSQQFEQMLTVTPLLLSLLVLQASQLFLPVTDRPLCITIQEQEKAQKQIHFFFQVTGNNPENFKVDFQSNSGKTAPFSLHGQSGKTQYIDANMKVCFISTDGGYKSVSVDFYTQDVAHLAQLAKKSHLYELHNKLISVGQKIKDVNRQQIFQEERQSIHGRIIEQHESKLKILVIIKLTAIVLVAGTQIYLLKTMLSKSSQGYQPV